MHPQKLTFRHRAVPMTVAAQLDQARADVRRNEWRRREAGQSAKEARSSLARELRVPKGTLENLIRGRLKRLDAWLRDGINRLVLRELEKELSRLSHELETRRRSGAHLASEQIGEVETHIEALRRAMSELA